MESSQEYLEAWGADGQQGVMPPTQQRAKHNKKLEEEQQEFLQAFKDEKGDEDEQ